MSVWHLLIFAVVVVLVFGTGKLSSIGPDLGSAIRGFKKNMKEEEEPSASAREKLEADTLSSESSAQRESPDHGGTKP